MNNNIKRGVWVAAVLLGCLGLAVSAQGASFDCGKAQTKVEHLICDNPEISKLDEELNVAYKDALKNQAQADSIKQAQKQWMKARNTCPDSACVKQVYELRLSSLRNTANSTRTKTTETDINKLQAHYVLIMSEDDSVCKPILAEYNRNISLDLWPQSAPHPYP